MLYIMQGYWIEQIEINFIKYLVLVISKTALSTKFISIVNSILELSKRSYSLLFSGRVFQICGPKHLKLLLPNVLCMDYQIIFCSVYFVFFVK